MSCCGRSTVVNRHCPCVSPLSLPSSRRAGRCCDGGRRRCRWWGRRGSRRRCVRRHRRGSWHRRVRWSRCRSWHRRVGCSRRRRGRDSCRRRQRRAARSRPRCRRIRGCGRHGGRRDSYHRRRSLGGSRRDGTTLGACRGDRCERAGRRRGRCGWCRQPDRRSCTRRGYGHRCDRRCPGDRRFHRGRGRRNGVWGGRGRGGGSDDGLRLAPLLDQGDVGSPSHVMLGPTVLPRDPHLQLDLCFLRGPVPIAVHLHSQTKLTLSARLDVAHGGVVIHLRNVSVALHDRRAQFHVLGPILRLLAFVLYPDGRPNRTRVGHDGLIVRLQSKAGSAGPRPGSEDVARAPLRIAQVGPGARRRAQASEQDADGARKHQACPRAS